MRALRRARASDQGRRPARAWPPYLTGNPEKDKAILKISPGKQGCSAAYNYVEELEKKNRS
nr:hypothetical protein OG781_04185 [Streptomyces sp. NBC_00830]